LDGGELRDGPASLAGAGGGPFKAALATRPWRAVRGWWRAGVDTLLSLAFPWECPVCGEGDDEGRPGPFCDDCRAELLATAGPACVRCAMPVGPWVAGQGRCRACRSRRLGFDAAVALGPYKGPLRDLCLRLKHERDAWLARWLAELVIEARPAVRDEAVRSPDALVVPVALHWRRRLTRGYNQADELARGLGRRLGLARAHALQRVRSTRILAGLGRSERARQLRGAFRVRRRWAAALKGRTVLLVDDILTSGATCGAAARALKQAGAVRVVVVVVARAEGRA
jgi:ComF family protein